MPEVVTLQVGQCGNQIAHLFWEQAYREEKESPGSIYFSESRGRKTARACIVDMEEGVINRLYKTSKLRNLFDTSNYITDVSGSGNNFAHGYGYYGPKYKKEFLNSINKLIEDCDSPQGFFFIYSLGGGTGSGVGSYLLESLSIKYPKLFKFSTCVIPSKTDDVVVSPYNACLSLSHLREFSDCCIPVSNDSLCKLCGDKKSKNAYDSMNSMVSDLLLNLTASTRFHGKMNVDLNELSTNLVPFPKLQFVGASQVEDSKGGFFFYIRFENGKIV